MIHKYRHNRRDELAEEYIIKDIHNLAVFLQELKDYDEYLYWSAVDWSNFLEGRECEVEVEVSGGYNQPVYILYKITTLDKIKEKALTDYKNRLEHIENIEEYG